MHTRHFTLVEVLISMAVLAVFMLGLLQFYSMSQTAMSLASDRAELYERARVALDMMTQDIACTYYSQDEEDLIPFQPLQTSKEFSVVTVRPEKLRTSDGKVPVTTMLGVRYRWDESKQILYYSSDTGRDTFSLDEAAWGPETPLIEGVTDFSIKPDTLHSKVKQLPASVMISLELIDKTAIRRIENTGNKSAVLENAPRRQFQRTVTIDRGQREFTN